MNEAVSSPEACRDLVRRTLTRFRLPYITVTPTFSICPKHGYLSGRHDFCPKCDAELLAKKYPSATIVKTYETDKSLNAISGTAAESERIAKAVASVKPDLVIASQCD